MTSKKAKTKVKRRQPWRPGGLITREVVENDPEGVQVVHHRVVDTLGRMLEAGTITPEMHAAARDFQASFTIASLDSMPSASLILVQPPGAGGRRDMSDAQVGARERVGRALDALGGAASPAGSCVWHIVGLQCSIREWALRQGWGGRPVKHEHAQGMLVAALGVLARHYGYDRGGRREK
jgi:hypothetical protein